MSNSILEQHGAEAVRLFESHQQEMIRGVEQSAAEFWKAHRGCMGRRAQQKKLVREAANMRRAAYKKQTKSGQVDRRTLQFKLLSRFLHSLDIDTAAAVDLPVMVYEIEKQDGDLQAPPLVPFPLMEHHAWAIIAAVYTAYRGADEVHKRRLPAMECDDAGCVAILATAIAKRPESYEGVVDEAFDRIALNGAPEQIDGSQAVEHEDEPAARGFLGGAALCGALGVDPAQVDAFMQQLGRNRETLGDGAWKEVQNRRPNDPQYLYRVDCEAIRTLAERYGH